MRKVDLSIIPSYHCNLTCWFCMYACSPQRTKFLDLGWLKAYLDTVEWNEVNSIGFYGGEISQWLDECQKYIDLIPREIPRFCITNGSWSLDLGRTERFIDFVFKNRLWVKISRTPEHTKHQNTQMLKMLSECTDGMFHIKERDDTEGTLNPMGRLAKEKWKCTKKCLRHEELQRLGDMKSGFKLKNYPYDRYAIEPDGQIIYQNCDGVYPVVSHVTMPFSQLARKCDRIKSGRGAAR